MDLATLIGLLAALGVILGSIAMGGDFGQFVNAPSLVVVVGGTIGTTLMKFPLSNFLGAFKIAMKAFISKPDSAQELIDEAMGLAAVTRKSGLLALEGQEIKNQFLSQGIQLCIDGHDAAFVKRMLSKDINLTIKRHETGQNIFKAIGETAPAMGMIGTLIGLVQMLANMDDPSSIGPAMAVALLTTLYGAIIANAFALPVAHKLSFRSLEERTNKNLILETITGIQEGLNPRVLESMLKTYLPGSKREESSEEAAE